MVRDSGFFENRTGGAKAGDLTKTNDGYLGVQINPARVSSRPQFNGPLQRFSPDTLCTVAFQRRHAPDCRSAAPEDAPCCSHRLTRNDSQETDCLPIVAIQLNLRRYALFSHENAHADGEYLSYVAYGSNL